MPHAWVIFEKHPSTEICYKEIAKFTKAVITGQGIETAMEIVNGKGEIEETPLNVESYPVDFSKPDVLTVSDYTDNSF